MGKRIVRLTEAELSDLLIKSIIGTDGDMLSNIIASVDKYRDPNRLKKLDPDTLKKLNPKFLPKDFQKKSIDSGKNKVSTSKEGYYELDLDTKEGYDAYVDIANNFISTRSSNLLGITGNMLADGAKQAYKKYNVYVPVELALAQLAQEGGFSSNRNARPIRTKNPFNVGNVDSGKNVFHTSVQSGINKYYDLMAKNYLSNKTTEQLLVNFVNKSGNRYATDKTYENKIKSIVNNIRTNSDEVYASAFKSKTSDLA